MKGSPPIKEVLQEIRGDHLSGATQLAERAAKFLLDYLKGWIEGELLVEIRSLGRDLVAAQPAMAPMVNLVNQLFRATETLEDPLEIKRRGIAALEGFLDGLIKGTEKIREHALPLLKGKKVVVTHSYSSTVLGVLGHAKGIEVICPEARPLCEGLKTARELGEKGIKVRFMVDCAALSLVGECDLVMVGADSITPEGVVNKTGTYGLALAAKEGGVPFYVLSGREKFLPPPFSQALRIERKDSGEVTKETIPNMVVENFYFEFTPLRLISAVVTPDGMITGDQVREILEKMEISEELKGL